MRSQLLLLTITTLLLTACGGAIAPEVVTDAEESALDVESQAVGETDAEGQPSLPDVDRGDCSVGIGPGNNLALCEFADNNLSGSNLAEANLTMARFSDSNMRGSDFSGAILVGTVFESCNLSGSDFRDADLTHAETGGNNFSGTSFINANLSYADLGGSNLTNADFSGATLTGADLSGANLNGAIISQEQLDQAASIEGAVLPKANAEPEAEEDVGY